MRYLITSALPYINGIKHLGNLAGSMLPADIYARFRRMQGHEVLFICATDEHGTPAELAAKEAEMDVEAYCEEQHEIQKNIYTNFRLSFDWFGRTSSPQNYQLTQHFYHTLEKNGLVDERKTKQVYSTADGRFLPDRYVEGTCPHCGYTSARGDQCDGCSSLLDPTELINPKSKISGSHDLEIRETSHLFLLQEKMQSLVAEWVSKASAEWPPLATSIARKWLTEGLKDRSITRDLEWGVSVREVDGTIRPGFENKVFYVWFDAPIGYISATQEWAKKTGQDWERWWKNDKGANDVDYTQFMGKDNVAFHTVSFPVTILGSGEPWKTVNHLKAFNWVNWYGDKFSTSQKRGVFMDQALAILPPDYWRWYLMANAPEGGDTAFTWETFQATCNADLSNNFGNFVSRITKFSLAKYGNTVPQGKLGQREEDLLSDLDIRLKKLTDLYSKIEIRKAASEIRGIWSTCNEYLANAAPWTQIKTDPEGAATPVQVGLGLCVLSAIISQPYIPDVSKVVLEAFNIDPSKVKWPESSREIMELIKPGNQFSAPQILFQRIEDAWLQEQSKAFAGITPSADDFAGKTTSVPTSS